MKRFCLASPKFFRRIAPLILVYKYWIFNRRKGGKPPWAWKRPGVDQTVLLSAEGLGPEGWPGPFPWRRDRRGRLSAVPRLLPGLLDGFPDWGSGAPREHPGYPSRILLRLKNGVILSQKGVQSSSLGVFSPGDHVEGTRPWKWVPKRPGQSEFENLFRFFVSRQETCLKALKLTFMIQ